VRQGFVFDPNGTERYVCLVLLLSILEPNWSAPSCIRLSMTQTLAFWVAGSPLEAGGLRKEAIQSKPLLRLPANPRFPPCRDRCSALASCDYLLKHTVCMKHWPSGATSLTEVPFSKLQTRLPACCSIRTRLCWRRDRSLCRHQSVWICFFAVSHQR
jgi:hypothetical protein